MGAIIERQKNWELRLIDAIFEEQNQPFEWGKHDCAILMAASVRAIYGNAHPALKEFVKYKNETSAKRLLAKRGGLDKIVSEYFDEINMLSAQQGDLGIYVADGFAAGLVIIDGAALGKSPDGIFRMPIKKLTKVYRV